MTALDLFRIAWARKGWLLAPTLIVAAALALVGAMLQARVSYIASRILSVSEGAQAEALFACKSIEVLAKALEGSRLEGVLTPQELATHVSATIESKLVKLSVERPSGEEAEYLVERIASEAAKAVVQLAREASAKDRAAIEDLEERLRQLRANRDAAQRELARLTAEHPVERSSHGELQSVFRRRLLQTQEELATARKELASLDAELAVMRTGAPGRTQVLPEAVARRLAELDGEIAKLREEMTDLHPRLAALLAERSRLEALPAVEQKASPPELATKEAARAGLAARIEELSKQLKEFSEKVEQEAAVVEEKVVRLTHVIKRTTDDIASAEEEIKEAKRKASGNLIAKAALEVKTKLPLQTNRSGIGPTTLGSLGVALGLVLGGLLAALAEAIDVRIRTSEDVTKHLDVPLLAEVPADALGKQTSSTSHAALNALLWLLVFVAVAAFILVLVYPGWDAIVTFFASRGSGVRP